MEPQRLLDVADLCVSYPKEEGTYAVISEMSFSVGYGETLGIVGESGSGKSMTLRALMGMVPAPGKVTSGQIVLDGFDMTRATGPQLERIRGSQLSMIFQDPGSSLNPVMSIGDQLCETLRAKMQMTRREASRRSVELLDRVGIASPDLRAKDYSHQLSGGMRQRVMIALAIATEPSLLLADEPTTSLDVTIQNQILSLLVELQQELGMAMILVSHDLGVVSQVCTDLAVMYAGRIVESGNIDEVLDTPRHPYTAALLAAVPSVTASSRTPLQTIGGQPPNIAESQSGCPFAPRCRLAEDRCRHSSIALTSGTHRVACIRAEVPIS